MFTKTSLFNSMVIATFLLVGCCIDPEQRLNTAFSESDWIEMKMLIGDELAEGIKFTYRTEEEKVKLDEGVGTIETADSTCLYEMGRLVFIKGEKGIAEMMFRSDGSCAYAWFESGMEGKAFKLSDSLAILIQDRFNLVSTVKGPKAES